jgi:hypothetical protein
MMRPPGRMLAAPGRRKAGRIPAGAEYSAAQTQYRHGKKEQQIAHDAFLHHIAPRPPAEITVLSKVCTPPSPAVFVRNWTNE